MVVVVVGLCVVVVGLCVVVVGLGVVVVGLGVVVVVVGIPVKDSLIPFHRFSHYNKQHTEYVKFCRHLYQVWYATQFYL